MVVLLAVVIERQVEDKIKMLPVAFGFRVEARPGEFLGDRVGEGKLSGEGRDFVRAGALYVYPGDAVIIDS